MDSSTPIFILFRLIALNISNSEYPISMVPVTCLACYFVVVTELRTLRVHRPLHLSKNTHRHMITTSQHFMLTLPPSVPYAFLPFSPTPTPYMLNLLHITKRSYVPWSTKYVPLHMCSFTSLLSNFMLMILNNIPRDQGDMLNMQLQHLYLQQFGTLVS